jgi:phosphoglycerate dehydrogenase-like enzyme
VAGRTVGIVGFGSVGSLLAEHLQQLGMTVLANDRPEGRARADAMGVELVVDREELAARSDFVVVTAALTEANRHMLGEATWRGARAAATA